MRPENLRPLIFRGGGDPGETGRTLDLPGFPEGRATNPTLVSRRPDAESARNAAESSRPTGTT
jgi:hypothetical protein